MNSESEFGDAIGDRHQVNSEIHSEAMIEHVGDAIKDQDRVNSEMHLEAEIERVSRCTLRP